MTSPHTDADFVPVLGFSAWEMTPAEVLSTRSGPMLETTARPKGCQLITILSARDGAALYTKIAAFCGSSDAAMQIP